ncbi:MBL fold metallo-hydrolase [Caulobacter sp. KR2-114]|uniref:MBL fold metallo-hydrolase n=1 Tax=Caulobacter sp. KR2-114 TaxID=3400912 RepID=UPI003C107CAC
MSVRLSFHGAAGCVTGFCARLETPQATLLVDCGMFQGSKTLKALNYQPFPFDAKSIDAVLLTHAHIDHSGLLPKLMLAGFDGPIWATTATRELCEVMLADSGSIQESEVEHLNRRNQRRGRATVEPIYTAEDGRRVVRQFRKTVLNEPAQVAPGVTATYWEAGHILGSASIQLDIDGEEPMRLLFSGDLGPGGRDYNPDPEGPAGIDHLVIESTYGDRERPLLTPEARRGLLADELNAAHEAGGPLLIPAFAVERTQELLADILTLMDDGKVPEAEIFLDSPLAIEATEIFQRRGWNRASGHNPFAGVRSGQRLKFLRAPWESDGLERLRGWHIIMAASGMCDAGRVRKHLERLLWRREATVLLTGYQAAGTLGRLLADGAKHVSIQGDDVRVAARVRMLDAYSGHADASALVRWAQARTPIRGSVFLAHGENTGLDGLRRRLDAAGVAPGRLIVPTLDESFRLAAATATAAQAPAARLAAASVASPDWHNQRAAFLADLGDRLEAASSDRERADMLARLRRVLGPG